MRTFYFSFLPAVVAVITGCASGPMVKPTVTGTDLISIAEIDYFSEKCSQYGRMALDTAAFGKRYVAQIMQNYQVDMREFNQNKAHINSFNAEDQETCNEVSLMILNVKSAEDAKRTRYSAPQSISETPFMPRTTRCNTAFGQTFCTTH